MRPPFRREKPKHYRPAEEKKRERRRAPERGRRRARTAAAVSYLALFRDGVAMNDLSRAHSPYRVGDICYHSASDEAQAAVCKRMRMLYNGLTPEVSMQTTLVTRPIHESEIGNRTFFEVRDDPTGPLAEEYNDVLNAKMREGVSNLVRERYITFAVDAPDAEHAVPALARMRSMASGVLTGIRSDLSPLDGAERAGLLRSMLRPAEPPLPVDWSEVAAHRGTTTKDLVAPNLIDFKPQGAASAFTMDGTWFQVLAFRRFESNLSDRCLADMVDLPIPLVISTHVRALEQNKAIGFVKQRLNWIDKEVVEDQMSAVKRGYDYTLLPAELRYTREEAQDMFERLKDDSQR